MQQPNLFSSETPPELPSQIEAARSRVAGSRPGASHESNSGSSRNSDSVPLWLRRIDLFLRVMVRLYLGLLLLALPWSHYWTDNHYFTAYAAVATLAESGAVRGVVSGVGLLNIWIALSEAFHYRDLKA